jgi:eukaryotic-like serine/threonine-protein kinase
VADAFGSSSDVFSGRVVPSTLHDGVSYRLKGLLGVGGMAMSYIAQRQTRSGRSTAVVKIVKPEVVVAAGHTAALAIRKEAVALGRLNEQTPPTPFVVRLLDTGMLSANIRGTSLELPWLALEHVSGGSQGTTLAARVQYSRAELGGAFSMERVIGAVECIGGGLEAIHQAGIVHRDLTPANVLCAGTGSSEVFKIADFGIARPKGMQTTFGNVSFGTPGYAAPEQSFPDYGEVGPWTDVFSFAAVIFYILTGEEYLRAVTAADALVVARGTERRQLRESIGLCEQLRASPAACGALDTILAAASAGDPTRRPASAILLKHAVLGTLQSIVPASSRRSALPTTHVSQARAAITEWNVVQSAPSGRVVRRAAWNAGGHCLALTESGLDYWDGADWAPCGGAARLFLGAFTFVAAVRPGEWLLAGHGGRALIYRSGNNTELLPSSDSDLRFTTAAGDPDDLCVFVAARPGLPPLLVGMASRRWIRPLELPGVAAVADLVRVGDARWLVCGALATGRGFACLFEPLRWQIGPVFEMPNPLVACAAPVREHGVCVGVRGGAVRMADGHFTMDTSGDGPDFWSVAADGAGTAWAGSDGSIWLQSSPGELWQCQWSDSRGAAPITSICADVDRVVAMTRDGTVIEGRVP